MGKYTPFGEFLRQQRTDEVRLTFDQIQAIIGSKLPPSSEQHRAWWSNNPHNSVLTQVWLAAGFRSEEVDMGRRRLVFRRARAQVSTVEQTKNRAAVSRRHPMFGTLKGLLRIAPGTDLTDPADPEWGGRP